MLRSTTVQETQPRKPSIPTILVEEKTYDNKTHIDVVSDPNIKNWEPYLHPAHRFEGMFYTFWYALIKSSKTYEKELVGIESESNKWYSDNPPKLFKLSDISKFTR